MRIMELYIGGYAQGKLEYFLRTHEGKAWYIVDGQELGASRPGDLEVPRGERLLINHFHLWVRGLAEEGEALEKLAEELEERYPDCAVISDEVGNGIVPMEQRDREYREQTGRILIALAARAERVERVICGLGQRLK